MMRGETDFEEKKIVCDSTLVITRIANSSFRSFSQSYEYAYRQGYFAGKAAGKRESLGSPLTETNATVANRAESQKGQP